MHQGWPQRQGIAVGQPGGRRSRSAQGISRQSGSRPAGSSPPAADARAQPEACSHRRCPQSRRAGTGRPPIEPDVMRREDYIAPGGVSGRPPVDRNQGRAAERRVAEETSRWRRRQAAVRNRARRSSWRRCRSRCCRPPKPAEKNWLRKSRISSCRSTRFAPAAPARNLSPSIFGSTSKSARPKAAGAGGPVAVGPRRPAPCRRLPPAEETGRERSRRGPRPAAAKTAASPTNSPRPWAAAKLGN